MDTKSGLNVCCGRLGADRAAERLVVDTTTRLLTSQTDRATLKLVVRNAGHTFRQGLNRDRDDILELMLEVETQNSITYCGPNNVSAVRCS